MADGEEEVLAVVAGAVASEASAVVREVAVAPVVDGNWLLFLSCTYAHSGDLESARALFNKVSQQDRLHRAYFVACVYIVFGNFEEAIA